MKNALRLIARTIVNLLLGPPPPVKPPRRGKDRPLILPRYGEFRGRTYRVLAVTPDAVKLRPLNTTAKSKAFWVPAIQVLLEPEGKELTLIE